MKWLYTMKKALKHPRVLRLFRSGIERRRLGELLSHS